MTRMAMCRRMKRASRLTCADGPVKGSCPLKTELER